MKSTVVEKAVRNFLQSLGQRNASVHTIKAYRSDLEEFAAYAGSRGWKQIDHVTIRGFLSHLYEKGLEKTSVARALAAVRSLYRWLAQEGVVEHNPAALVSTPKLPKKLPRVPTIEEMNGVLDGEMPEVAAFPERDRMILLEVEVKERRPVDLARELGVSEARISQLRTRAKARLREAMGAVDSARDSPGPRT